MEKIQLQKSMLLHLKIHPVQKILINLQKKNPLKLSHNQKILVMTLKNQVSIHQLVQIKIKKKKMKNQMPKRLQKNQTKMIQILVN
jgi:hypothetical protein